MLHPMMDLIRTPLLMAGRVSTAVACALCIDACASSENPPQDPAKKLWSEQMQSATSARQQGQLEVAEGHLRAAMSTAEGAGRNRLQARATEGIAQLKAAQGEVTEADKLFRQTLNLQMAGLESADIPGHDVLITLGALGDLNMSRNRVAEARAYYDEILQLGRNGWVQLSPRDPSLAYTLDGLARVHEALGEHGIADTLTSRATAIKYFAQGYHQFVVGQYTQAQDMLQRALALQERSLGGTHPDVAYTCAILAQIYDVQDMANKAVPLYERAIELYDESGDHAHAAVTLENLAVALAKGNRAADAASARKRARRLLESGTG
ncbi:MAG: tetratricopeptide repeat protein [Candidatus Latescibacterota bacterium]|nr:tetratricopeptide repeat protein [Candidatus Latescibacterota bacterium]